MTEHVALKLVFHSLGQALLDINRHKLRISILSIFCKMFFSSGSLRPQGAFITLTSTVGAVYQNRHSHWNNEVKMNTSSHPPQHQIFEANTHLRDFMYTSSRVTPFKIHPNKVFAEIMKILLIKKICICASPWKTTTSNLWKALCFLVTVSMPEKCNHNNRRQTNILEGDNHSR